MSKILLLILIFISKTIYSNEIKTCEFVDITSNNKVYFDLTSGSIWLNENEINNCLKYPLDKIKQSIFYSNKIKILDEKNHLLNEYMKIALKSFTNANDSFGVGDISFGKEVFYAEILKSGDYYNYVKSINQNYFEQTQNAEVMRLEGVFNIASQIEEYLKHINLVSSESIIAKTEIDFYTDSADKDNVEIFCSSSHQKITILYNEENSLIFSPEVSAIGFRLACN